MILFISENTWNLGNNAMNCLAKTSTVFCSKTNKIYKKIRIIKLSNKIGVETLGPLGVNAKKLLV